MTTNLGAGMAVCKACPRCHHGDMVLEYDVARSGVHFTLCCLQCGYSPQQKNTSKDNRNYLLFPLKKHVGPRSSRTPYHRRNRGDYTKTAILDS